MTVLQKNPSWPGPLVNILVDHSTLGIAKQCVVLAFASKAVVLAPLRKNHWYSNSVRRNKLIIGFEQIIRSHPYSAAQSASLHEFMISSLRSQSKTTESDSIKPTLPPSPTGSHDSCPSPYVPSNAPTRPEALLRKCCGCRTPRPVYSPIPFSCVVTKLMP